LLITGHCVAGVVGQAFHFHITEATCNLLDHVGVYYCEEMGLTHIKVLLMTGVFYIAIYVIGWPACSIHPQHFVKSHAFTTGKTAVQWDNLE